MDRRSFSLGFGSALMGGALVSPFARAARANEGEVFTQGALRALRLRFPDATFQTMDGFIVTDSSRAVGVSWTQHLPCYHEDRVTLSRSGLGGLFRTPFRVRWQQARVVGNVDLVGSRLVARGSPAAASAMRVTVGAGDYSWDLPGRLSAASALGAGGRPVGALRQEADGRLLVRVNATPAF
ncbi:hypothetical protein [Pararhodobacter oceanensis]|uniref:hypothetical protein n=1 Tax=Pararhodobacter oceanensis TaxID=2172121 RepID=UPI003A8D6CE1